jgi:uncharacterized protein involved in type VI secretion and phage assembly
MRSVPSERWYGVYPALVTDNRDPEGIGRVKVALPWAPDPGGATAAGKAQRYEAWARLATMAAGADRGSWFLPDVDDEVLVSFEAGHPGRPVVVGALWNGKDVPPVAADKGNTVKVLRTRSGSEIHFTDQAGEAAVAIRTSAGQSVLLTAAKGGAVQITDGSNHVTLAPSGVTVQASASVRVAASAVTIEAGAIHLKSAMVTCDGVIKGSTLIVDSVVASTYTPGAGNVS